MRVKKQEFMECDACRAKPGSPVLCAGCINNRMAISLLNRFVEAEPAPEGEMNDLGCSPCLINDCVFCSTRPDLGQPSPKSWCCEKCKTEAKVNGEPFCRYPVTCECHTQQSDREPTLEDIDKAAALVSAPSHPTEIERLDCTKWPTDDGGSRGRAEQYAKINELVDALNTLLATRK